MEKIWDYIVQRMKAMTKQRLIVTVIAVVLGIWILGTLIGLLVSPNTPASKEVAHESTPAAPASAESNAAKIEDKSDGSTHAAPALGASAPGHGTPVEPATEKIAAPAAGHGTGDKFSASDSKPARAVAPAGVQFVEAVRAPLAYELKQRFWGWRPNDILDFTDNVNSYQIGVLEVTRRAVVTLAERIARTGSTDAFNPHLENAMNFLMVTAQKYWFPAPESKYLESLDELEMYKEQLIQRKASFYTRTDNLIPLLTAFEDLLGSCDEHLVKVKEADGTKVTFFRADDYFYYAKGVADSMAKILEAVSHDYASTLENRHGAELLHHAIESCRRAASLDPIFILNSDLDGVLANHRANMAAPISHAQFYLGQLIKTLST